MVALVSGSSGGCRAGRTVPWVKIGGFHEFFSRFVRDESGATAIEYGLIAALIAVVIITAVTSVGTNLTTTFTTVAGKIL